MQEQQKAEELLHLEKLAHPQARLLKRRRQACNLVPAPFPRSLPSVVNTAARACLFRFGQVKAIARGKGSNTSRAGAPQPLNPPRTVPKPYAAVHAKGRGGSSL